MSLFKDDMQQHLKSEKGDISNRMRAETYPGMAHFAGTGPLMETCRTCMHFQHGGYAAGSGELRKGRCGHYKILTQSVGAQFPNTARSCKYFVFNPGAPKRFKDGR